MFAQGAFSDAVSREFTLNAWTPESPPVMETAAPVASGEASAAPVAEDGAAAPALQACQQKVNAVVAAKQKDTDADDEMKKCCQSIAEDYDKRKASWMGSDRFYCCGALNWLGSRACTPWGPPMPPEMSWGLA